MMMMTMKIFDNILKVVWIQEFLNVLLIYYYEAYCQSRMTILFSVEVYALCCILHTTAQSIEQSRLHCSFAVATNHITTSSLF